MQDMGAASDGFEAVIPGARPTAAASATVVSDYTVILSGSTWWGSAATSGKAVFLTYSFETSVPADYDPSQSSAYYASFKTFDATAQAAARAALNAWASISGITLLEVPSGQGDIAFLSFDLSLNNDASLASAAGFANYPGATWYTTGTGTRIEGVQQRSFVSIDDQAVPKTTGDLHILLHEIGHTLGFKHPFEGSPVLPTSLDNWDSTAMSYTQGSAAYNNALGTLDVQAVKVLYGDQSKDGSQVATWSWDATTYTLSQSGFDTSEVIRGTAAKDIIYGNGGDDSIIGAGGNDLLDGGAGNDAFMGGAGDDTISGGTGNDVVFAGDGNDQVDGGDGDDYLSGGNGNDLLSGGAGSDTLYSGNGNSTLNGGDGNDVLSAGNGSATLNGGAGADWLGGGSGVYKMYGGAGGDVYLVGNVADIVDETVGQTTDDGAFDWVETSVSFTLPAFVEGLEIISSAGTIDVTGNGLNNTFYGDANANRMFGLGGADYMDGDAGNDTLDGGAGNDTLFGNAGDDRLVGGAGADVLQGGAGIDIAAYDTATSGVTASLLSPAQNTGDAAGDSYNLIEGLAGSAYADRLTGDAGDNSLYGAAGSDTLSGGSGNDALYGGAGADSLDGGAGTDIARYDDAAAGVTASLASPGGNTGDAAGDSYTAIEGLAGSAFADALTGDGGANSLYGLDGNDTLTGGAGTDFLDGGAGTDTAVLAGTMAQSTVSFDGNGYIGLTASGQSDTLANIEWLQFSDRTAATAGLAAIVEGYLSFFARLPNASELGVWSQGFSAGTTVAAFNKVLANDAAGKANTPGLVSYLYDGYLGRAPSPSEISYWSGALQSGAVSLASFNTALANDGSGQANSYLSIKGLYDVYLGRDPGAAEVAFWAGALKSGSYDLHGFELVLAVQSGAAGNTASYVAQAYQAWLGRSPTGADSAYWTGQFTAGTMTPVQLRQALIADASGQAYIASTISAAYQAEFGRDATASDVTTWKSLIAGGASFTTLTSALLGDNAGAMAKTITSAYDSYFGRDPTASELGVWRSQFANGATASGLRAALVGDASGQAHTASEVASLYQTYLGRAPSASDTTVWKNQVAGGSSFSQVHDALVSDTGSMAHAVAEITVMYQAIESRAPSAAETSYWIGAFNGGTSNLDSFIDTLLRDGGSTIATTTLAAGHAATVFIDLLDTLVINGFGAGDQINFHGAAFDGYSPLDHAVQVGSDVLIYGPDSTHVVLLENEALSSLTAVNFLHV